MDGNLNRIRNQLVLFHKLAYGNCARNILPVAETVIRIQEVCAFENFFRGFDYYTLGAVTLFTSFLVWKKGQNAIQYLIDAWGMWAGELTGSLYGQLDSYFKCLPETGTFSSGFMLSAKGFILFHILIGLPQIVKAANSKSLNEK